MASSMVVGGVALVASAAGGLGFAIYEDVRTLDIEIEAELDSLTMRQRLMDGDILDGLTDLRLYTDAVAEGPEIVAGFRADHPIGSFIRTTGIRRLEDGYAAMRLNYETFNKAD